MRRNYSPSRWLATLATSLLFVSLVLALVGPKLGAEPIPVPRAGLSEKPEAIVPLFGKTEPAANTPVLVLMPHERGVQGWVSGKGPAIDGGRVTIMAGSKGYEVKLRDDDTFTWEQTTNKNLAVTASVAYPDVAKALTARLTAQTTLLPSLPTGGPTAFFITDRSAYRPGHTLKFVAFLRQLLPSGEFEPVGNREVTVDLTSQTKGTRASRMKLRADAQGRVTGEYTFSDADALDHYTLVANEFTGGARVFLGEYRKTKVGLKLTGEVQDGKLVVTFDARDYLDRPVKGTSATYTATVTRTAEPAKLTLNPDEFVKPESGPPGSSELEALPDDERLISLANGVSAMTFAGFGSRHVSSREGSANVDADGKAKLTLDLNPVWLKGNNTVSISGVFVDDTGRENRGVGTFKLDPRQVCGVIVNTSKEMFVSGETIPVNLTPFGLKRNAKFATTLIVVRLEAQPANLWVTTQVNPNGSGSPDNTRLPGIVRDEPTKPASDAAGWKNVPVFDPVRRVVVSAEPVVDNAATLALNQPGAYKLLAVTKLPDGTAFHSETGFVVKSPAKLPGVVLQLDKREIDSSSRLTGAVHTRFAGAKLLLTIRDSQGIKVAKPLTADERGVARFDEVLPANLRYGCSVCVQYPESPTVIHADQRELFVIPTDRTIGVTTTVPAEVGPGADIKLGVKLDRAEEVNLIVSVFDDSLQGVSGDLSKNIRNHFLADARGQGRAARDLANTRIGAITVADLVTKAEAMLKDKEALAKEPGLEQRLRGVIKAWVSGKLTLVDVVTLVRLTGLEVYLAQPVDERAYVWQLPRFATLADVLRWEQKRMRQQDAMFDVYISATVVGNVAMIGVAYCTSTKSPDRIENTHPTDPWVGHRGNPYGYGYGFGHGFGCVGPNYNFCGGFQCTGFGSQFGFQGIQGQRFQFNGVPPGFGGQFQGGGFGGIAGAGPFPQTGPGYLGIGGGALGVPSVAGFQGGFSHPANMGLGLNTNLGPSPVSLPPMSLPGLGIADEMVRRDFADSAYWSATLRTDKTGNASATFKLPDSLTNWRVQVTAISSKMHVGTGTAKFKSTRAVMIWPMLPRTFTEGDTIRIFGTVHNLTDKEQTIRAHLKAENGQVLSDAEQTVKVPPNGSVPVYWNYKAGTKGFTDLLMSARCDAGSDASLKKLPVTAAGVLERATASGFVGKGDLKLNLPDDIDLTRATATVTLAPTLAADLTDTLPYLVDYPYGCVEQTMSRFLPALRVAHILKQSGISTSKELEAKLPKVVAAGQKRLIELQQSDGGWGWNGNSTTHEMMTPYALFGLISAEEAGYPCPNPTTIPNGLSRLDKYLTQMLMAWDDNGLEGRARRKGEINDSLFCLWVATLDPERAKKLESNIDVWLSRIEMTTGDPMMSDTGHALALEIAIRFGKKGLITKLAAELLKRAKKSGDHVFWTTGGFSRWGDNTTEVTAAVMKALVAYDSKHPLIPGILAYFHGAKRGDRWDSTKDTACVLYALCDYLATVQTGPRAVGLVNVKVNGTDDGNVRLDSPTSKVIKLTGKTLKPGENTFTVTGPEKSGGALVRVVVSYTRGRGADIPARDHGVKVERTISLRGDDGTWTELKSGAPVPTGSYVKVRVTATPGPGTTVQYTLLESPKPAGGETVPADDSRFKKDLRNEGFVLREDREAMTCFHYERAAGGFTAEYVVLTEFVGEFRVAPARVELMYKPTVGGHSDSFALKVEARTRRP